MRLSMALFNDLIAASEKTYENVRNTLSCLAPTPFLLDSYYVVKKKIEKIAGVTQLQRNMCVKSCVAFVGPFKELDKCPTCGEARYEENLRTKKPQLRQQFYTIPLGPQIQALWCTPEGADCMQYHNRKTDEIIQTLITKGKIPLYEDVFHGTEYLDAVCDGRIGPDDVMVTVSLDGAQLYCDKESDCYFGIWVILDLSPDKCYKKKFVLPAFFVPGPNKPNIMESFLLPSFRHVMALQKEGLKVYDGHEKCLIVSRPFFGFGTADTLALPILSGSVGHNGNSGCRQSCGMPGRHPPTSPPIILWH